MNKMTMMGVWLIALFSTGCNQDLVEYNSNDLKISIEKGEEWLHKFPLFLGINKKNPPQIAIWTEDMKGHYLSTVYVTHKIATQPGSSPAVTEKRGAAPLVLSERSRIGGRLISSDKEVSTGRWNHRSDSAGKLPSENGPYGKTEAVRRQSRNQSFDRFQ